MIEHDISDNRDNTGSASQLPDFERRMFGMLIERIEHLARDLGRNEGQQDTLHQQITQLEGQKEALRCHSEQES